MAADAQGLPEEGLALWLTEQKVSPGVPWLGRHLVASVGGAAAGQLDFFLHPDGQAVKVFMLRVHPDFQRRGLAGVMMDALYAAYPTAWINHGWRTKEGAQWWNGYREPVPHRNVHNRPPAEWAAYFDAVDVASDKAHNAHQNSHYGLDGNRGAVYRYGERLETEAALHASAYRQVAPVHVDPGSQPLHGAARLALPPAVHAYVHDRTQDSRERATALLEHFGHGNLPRRAYWNTTRQAAFADAHHETLFERPPAGPPLTHVVFTLAPLQALAPSTAQALATSVEFQHPGDTAVDVTELAWREADRPHLTHQAGFAPNVAAAIAPVSAQQASASYQARYDEAGFLRATARNGARPFADRAAQIQAMAERLLGGRTERARTAPPPSAPPQTAPPHPPAPGQRPPGPGRRA
ncbi:GNAT family N-acetyltransferase [Streptomyces sp. BE147]|uniref:GNAT family N-acetyltransferase n=1 Tax=Streptomyces sp. BE147 TaxID=3002524 RepID=UPI002E75FC5F|nr:GNAT family N-acetyltransferase [Streptomyces sp. BE147]MEE1736415.1 GNAT family N-acetyltransferase [Streptomyces sp. BE147]